MPNADDAMNAEIHIYSIFKPPLFMRHLHWDDITAGQYIQIGMSNALSGWVAYKTLDEFGLTAEGAQPGIPWIFPKTGVEETDNIYLIDPPA